MANYKYINGVVVDMNFIGYRYINGVAVLGLGQAQTGRIMSSLVNHGGLAGQGGLAGKGGGLAG